MRWVTSLRPLSPRWGTLPSRSRLFPSRLPTLAWIARPPIWIGGLSRLNGVGKIDEIPATCTSPDAHALLGTGDRIGTPLLAVPPPIGSGRWVSYWHRFRGEPASTRSDWHFTAFQGSSEGLATPTRSIRIDLALERSSSFGSNRRDLSGTSLSDGEGRDAFQRAP